MTDPRIDPTADSILPARMPTRTILTGLNLWDGNEHLPADTLILNGGRIESICPREVLTAAEGRQAQTLSGATALPGLIDAHVHLVLDPEQASPPGPGQSGRIAAMRERASAMVSAGITSARDLGGGGWLEVGLRDAIDRGETPGPRLLCAGQPITSPGGHCHFWGGEADGAQAARAVIDRQLEQNVDLIKVMATGGRFTRGSRPLEPQFDTETLTEIVVYARQHGKPVAAHCHGTAGIEAATRAGVHSIEHCSWVGPAGWASDYSASVVAEMISRGTWVSPTINRGWQRMIDANNQTLLRMREALVAMRAAGVPFMASTDAGIPGVFHHQLPEALQVFARVADLNPAETLRTATSRAAAGLGLAGKTGRLAPGLDADVLIVDGDPLGDLSALTRPLGIWARGRLIRQP